MNRKQSNNLRTLFHQDKEERIGNYILLGFYFLPGICFLLIRHSFFQILFLNVSVPFALGFVQAMLAGLVIINTLPPKGRKKTSGIDTWALGNASKIVRYATAILFMALNWSFVYFTPDKLKESQFKLIILFTVLFLVYPLLSIWLDSKKPKR